jgi:phage terminase large subunit-like protein
MAANPVTQYAQAVTAGLIVAGPSVRAACRRHLADLETGAERGWRFDLAKATRAIDFFPDVLTVEVDGKVRRFELLLWQKFVVGSIFGWVSIETGFRRFDRAYIESGKGSGKTPLMAGIGLYMMLADGELSAEVYAAAAKREQAMRMFTDVVDMVDRSARLQKMLRQTGQNPVWKLRHPPTKSVFQPVSSDKAKSGARVSCGLVDELHEHKDRYTIDMLEAGFKNRKQPLMMVATNAGHDRESICYEWHDHAVAVVEGLRLDDALFSFVLDLDPDDDPLEISVDLVDFEVTIAGKVIVEKFPRCWLKTNPGIGYTVTVDYLRKQVNAAREIPGRENGVRRLNFCQWTDAETTWITRAAWTGCEEQLGDVEAGKVLVPSLVGAECYLGLDLSFAFDLTALAFVFPDPIVDEATGLIKLAANGDELVNLLAWIEYFTPAETAAEREKKDRVPYQAWIRDGLVHGVPDKIVRLEYMSRRIAEVTGMFDVRWSAFDRYRHKELQQQMSELGVSCNWIEHPQGFRRAGRLELNGRPVLGPDGKPVDNPLWMPDSVMKFEGRILDRTLKVQPSLVTRWQVSSTVIRKDPAGTGNHVFDKAKATGRIDGMVALAEAIGAAEMRLPQRDLSGFLNRPVMAR